MAAHILRVLNEFATKEMPVDQVVGVLEYTPMGDQLETDEWLDLREAIRHETRQLFVECVQKIMPKYVTIFFELDCPRTHEEWAERRIAKRGY